MIDTDQLHGDHLVTAETLSGTTYLLSLHRDRSKDTLTRFPTAGDELRELRRDGTEVALLERPTLRRLRETCYVINLRAAGVALTVRWSTEVVRLSIEDLEPSTE